MFECSDRLPDSFLFPPPESAQAGGSARGTSTLGRDREIKKLNEEIDRLKKKLAGEVARWALQGSIQDTDSVKSDGHES